MFVIGLEIILQRSSGSGVIWDLFTDHASQNDVFFIIIDKFKLGYNNIDMSNT